MKRRDFDAALQNNTLPPAIMLYGESHFLIDYYIKQLCIDKTDANILSFYFEEYDYANAKAHLSQGSLFGGMNILMIKTEKKTAKKELDSFIELCEKNPDNAFIYAYYGSDYKTSYKSFTKKGISEHIRLFPPFYSEARKIMSDECQKRGIKIEGYALNHLLLQHNSTLELAYNDLSKLEIFDRTITQKDIDEHVFGLSEVNQDVLFTQLLMKKPFIDHIQQKLEAGEDEIKILTALSGFITQLFLFNIYIKLHGAISSKEVLGYSLPAFIEKERAELCIKIKQESYQKMLALLLECELTLKTQQCDKTALLLSNLIKLQTFL